VTLIKNGFASSKCIYPLSRAGEARPERSRRGEGEGAKCGAPPSPSSLHGRARRLFLGGARCGAAANTSFGLASIVSLVLFFTVSLPSQASETLDQLIAAARTEKELYFVAGPTTFGGKKGLSEIEAAFNKKFGINSRILFTAGPEMNSMAARVITELKAGGKSSTDVYLGSLGQFAHLQKENVLQEVNWSGTFPWVTREMEETLSRKGVLVYTSPRGIIYNASLLPQEKAPKKYEDLIDPRLSPTWAGKLALPPYPNWLVELSLMWGEERVKDFTRRLVALGGGWLRYGEEERVISGEFPIMANIGDALAAMWKWQSKGGPLVAVLGTSPGDTSYFHLGVPKNSGHPRLARLFVAFMISKEGQSILDKHDFRSSHLVEGSRMAKYLRDHGTTLQDPKELFNFYLKGGGFKLNEELARLLKQ
jgi:ABC-type Fe3+ transport system substrate-binding protein